MLLIQATIIVGTSILGIVAHHAEIGIAEIIPYILLSFAIGQLTASGSLVAAIAHNRIKDDSKYLTSAK